MTNPLYVSPSLDLSCDESCDLYYPQNLPSVVTSHILDPQPSEVILDMCAAPGGKTTHIASLLGNTVRHTVMDILFLCIDFFSIGMHCSY